MSVERLIRLLKRYSLQDALADLEGVLEELGSQIDTELSESDWREMIDPGYRARNLQRDSDRLLELQEAIYAEV